MDHSEKPLSLLSLCTGMRGLEKGVDRAIASLRGYRGDQGWQGESFIKPAAYVEIDPFVAWNLVAQMEQGVLAPVPVWTDVKTFPWRYFRGKICILIGGYPCQPFSTAGKQLGIYDTRHLFPHFERGIDAIRPVCCFFENVVNHLNIGYRDVRNSLEALGYQVKEGIFSAEEVGAPHLRKRLFILAVANSYCTKQSTRRGDLAKMFGLQEGQCQPEFRSAVSGGGGPQLGDTEFQRSQGSNGVQKPTIITESGQGVALGHSFGTGLAIGQKQSTREKQSPAERTSLWPAGQGQQQHEWEYARLEPRMGFTIDGYDYTEDLLRMAGNAVVEQQAELAFRTLIQKFL